MSGGPPGERIAHVVGEPHNRTILTVLEDAEDRLHVTDLAERLRARDGGPFGSAQEGDLEGTVISLHHDHLPRLAEAGLVEYDYETNVVESASAAADAEWLDADRVDELVDQFRPPSGGDESDIGVIRGRENVIEHGRTLADEADDELFLMYVSEDLLEDACLDHARDAVERDVDIYLGSQNPNVRDLTRRHLPEATLWEPQLDWMNVPSRYPKIGRFVFADREHVMLAVLDEPDPDGDHPETAVTGSGSDNPLVVLVRELLGPRLDHLDYQSEEFRGELPF